MSKNIKNTEALIDAVAHLMKVDTSSASCLETGIRDLALLAALRIGLAIAEQLELVNANLQAIQKDTRFIGARQEG